MELEIHTRVVMREGDPKQSVIKHEERMQLNRQEMNSPDLAMARASLTGLG